MKRLKLVSYLLLLNSASVSASASANDRDDIHVSKVVLADDIQWGYLNPLRGNKSPGAAELWGDRTKDESTGMLVKFNKGFSSPPHIHNISYRGIVIDGLMHNDDPMAERMWMPQGSFWTQPAGENHITAASGISNLIYLEIDRGPYLVKPSDEAFNNGESPINLHKSNMVWLNSEDVMSIKGKNGSEISPLWGSNVYGELGGTLIKLPTGFSGVLAVNAEEFRAVIIKGNITYESIENKPVASLAAGSYFDSKGQFVHKITTQEETLIYIRTNGAFSIL